MNTWLNADEFAVEWLLWAELQPVAATPAKPAQTQTVAARRAAAGHTGAHRRRPQPADDYYATRAREEIARMHEMFSRNTYREELRQILLEARQRQADWEKEHAA